jgi:PAS domain-containing protein
LSPEEGARIDVGNQPPSVLPSQSELERLFDLPLDLFCIAGFDGYFRRVNLAFERTLGYSKEWLLSRPMLDTVHPDDLQSCYDALGDLANGNDLIGFENRVSAPTARCAGSSGTRAPCRKKASCTASPGT